MVKKSGGWNLQDMQDTLVKDTEQKISDGFEEIKSESQQPLEPMREITDQQEPTKGVQTYIPISQYIRLSNQKLTRPKGTTIAILAAEAICLWLNVQEGKLSVSPK